MPQEISQRRLWKIDVDIPLCLMCFAISLTGNVLTDFIVYRTCYVTLGYNKTECALLNSKDTNDTSIKDLEEKVQVVASLFTMSSTVIGAIIPATLGMFMGPWSDKHGRKPLIALPLIGYMIHLCIIVTLTFIPNASPIFIVLSALPMSFSGGFSAMLTGIYCYISDLVPVNNRAVRIGILQGMLSFGIIVGGLSSAPLLKATNYSVVFGTAAFMLFIAVMYTIFLVPESVRNQDEPGGLFSMVDCNLVIDLWSTCFKQRSENRRLAIWLIIMSLGLMLFKMDGTFQLDYLFVREKFHWTLQQQSIYSAITSFTGIIGSMLTIYIFSKLLNVSEVILGLVSFISAASVAFMKAFAQTSWQMYMTIPVGMFEGMGSPMCRTLLSRMVPEQELGKVFAMAASLEAIMPLISAPTYTYIYDNTLTTFAGAFYLLCAATELLIIVLFCILYFVTRNLQTSSNITPVKLNDDIEGEEDE